ncbi:recombinase family protein [Psychrilyobacter atlanticus]|uniref:recombinase family protein n=1 Tax=Psychrilyobacter atlanticus TaxID=271091 RepID=UPI0004030CF8|nr:recombinase family protein [Psychrilyobacter atlanticus]
MLKGILYCRVSTEMQEEKESLKYQIEKGKSYSKSQDIELTKTITDVESGGRDDRDGFLELQREIKARSFDVLVVYEASRISRKMITMIQFVLQLQEQDIKFISISQPDLNTTTATGMLFFQIQASLAEYERKQISIRVKSGKYERAKVGQFTGGTAPLGYDVIEKKLTPNEDAELVNDIFDYYLRCQSMAATGKKFNRNNESIRWMLKNEVYIGKKKWGQKEKNLMTHKQKTKLDYEVFDGEHEGIVPEEIFEKVQTILKLNSKRRIEFSTSGALFAGLIRCACGNKMYNSTLRNTKKNYHYYQCDNKRCNLKIPREKLETKLLKQIYALKELKDLNNTEDLKVVNYTLDIEKLKVKISKSKNKRKKLTRSFASGLIEDDDFEDLVKEIKNDISIYENEIEELEEIRDNEKNLEVRNDNLELFIDVMENLEPEDINDAKKVMRFIINRIELHDDNKKNPQFDIYFN